MSEKMTAEQYRNLPTAKTAKYRNEKIVVDGITFDSLKEANRYGQLCAMQKARLIHDLELQPNLPIEFNGIKICTYKADFKYIEAATNEMVYEDVKGLRLPFTD